MYKCNVCGEEFTKPIVVKVPAGQDEEFLNACPECYAVENFKEVEEDAEI